MAIYGTPANKAAAFKLYSNKSLSDLDSDNNGSKGSSTHDAAPKPNTIEARISGAPAVYTKA